MVVNGRTYGDPRPTNPPGKENILMFIMLEILVDDKGFCIHKSPEHQYLNSDCNTGRSFVKHQLLTSI